MNFGFCNALYGELSVAQNLEKSRALGFGTYETGAWSLLKRDKFDGGRAVRQSHLDDWSLIDDIGQAAADTGVSICCLHAPPPGIKLGDPDFDDNFFIYEALLARMQKLGIDAVNLRHGEWEPELRDALAARGRLVFAWDLQEVETLRAALAFGVDAVYSDYVDRMQAVLAEPV